MLKLATFLLLTASLLCSQSQKPVLTQVTFLYDIKRGDLGEFKRDFKYYLNYFDQLLRTDMNLIVFGAKQLEDFVWERREKNNTIFVRKEVEEFKKYWYAELTQKTRQKLISLPNFPHKQTPQFALQLYNLLVMGKIEVMSEAIKHDKWNTDILIWTDGGFMHQFKQSIFYPQNIVRKVYQTIQPQFLLFGYYIVANIFIGYQQHEFGYINRFVKHPQKILASTMGGNIRILEDIRSAYNLVARITLENGDLSAEESLLTLMPFKYPFLVPVTTNIYMGDWANHINLYEDVSKIKFFPRSWKGKVDTKGDLAVKFSANSTRTKESPTDGPSVLQMKRKPLRQNGDDFIQSLKPQKGILLQYYKHFIHRTKIVNLVILIAKSFFFLAFIIIYFFLIAENKKLSKKCTIKEIAINEK